MKSYTDIEQSKKLAKILPVESADMYYFLDPTPAGNIYHLVVQRVDDGTKNLPEYDKGDIPCWSLTALFDVLPKYIGDYSKCLYYDVGGYYCGYMNDGDFMLTIEETNADNHIDACVAMVLKLHEKELL